MSSIDQAQVSNPRHDYGLATPYPSPRSVTSATVGLVAAAFSPGRHPPPRRSTPSPSFPSRTPREPRPEAHARLEPVPQSEYEPARAPSSSTPRAYRREVWRASTRRVSRRRSRRRPRARSVCGPARPSTRHPNRYPNRHPNRQPNAQRHLRPRSKPSSRSRASFRSRVEESAAFPRASGRDLSGGGGLFSRTRSSSSHPRRNAAARARAASAAAERAARRACTASRRSSSRRWHSRAVCARRHWVRSRRTLIVLPAHTATGSACTRRSTLAARAVRARTRAAISSRARARSASGIRRFGGRGGATRALWDRSGIVAGLLDASARTVVAVARVRVSRARNRSARGSVSSEMGFSRGAVAGRTVPMARSVARTGIARDGWRLPK